MVIEHHVEGYENFLEFIKDFNVSEPKFMLFTGSKLPTGKSWCPDCVEAEPHISKGIHSAPDNVHFVVVEVGDRPFWKDLKCPFRTNNLTHLSVLPTLVKWGTQKRLEGDQLLNSDLIDLLFTDEED